MSPSRNIKPAAVVGVDIGSNTIKVAEAKFGKDGITITALGSAQLPAGLIENEVILDPKALGQALKALLAESGIKTKRTVSSVSGQSRVVVRVIEVPKMSSKELAETMKWEVERHVPFPPNEVIMDYKPLDLLGNDPNAQNMEILLAVAQDDLINKHVEALQTAGLKPVAIDIEPLAASRTLIEATSYGQQTGVIAIVNIGANNTELSVFDEGVLVFPSPPLGIAGSMLTHEISEAMGLTLEDAENTKREYAAIDLNGFGIGGGSGTAAPDGPTAFGTSFSPTDAGTFDSSQAQQPAAGGFASTIDGPVFDQDDPLGFHNMGGTAPEQTPEGTPAAEATEMPAFDLGTPQFAGPSFDFATDTPAEPEVMETASVSVPEGPSFDLEDDSPEPTIDSKPVAPAFDLSDVHEGVNPGDQVDYVDPDLTMPGYEDSPRYDPTRALNETEQKVFNAISGPLMDLATELRRSLEYYSSKYQKVPHKVYLCGGSARIPNLDKFLSNELGVPVAVADPVRKLRVKAPMVSPPALRDMSPSMSVCIGLAIRDMLE